MAKSRHRLFKLMIVAFTSTIATPILYMLWLFIPFWIPNRTPEQSRRAWSVVYKAQNTPTRQCLSDLGLSPDAAIIGPGRVQTPTFSRFVLQPDPVLFCRMIPNNRAVWYRLPIANFLLDPPSQQYILGPDNPHVRESVSKVGGIAIEGSEQTTNSWGWRGPEPDLNADLRILVTGDSLMQGMLVADGEEPPQRLASSVERRASSVERRASSVSVLNASIYGFGPKQYFSCVEEYLPKFRPHVVLINLCVNDVEPKVPGDIEIQREHLHKAISLCNKQKIPCLVVAMPVSAVLTGEMQFPGYPESLKPAVPEDAWIDLHETFLKAQPDIKDWLKSPLFNGRWKDGHMSPKGTEVWGEAIAAEIEKRGLLKGIRSISAPKSDQQKTTPL